MTKEEIIDFCEMKSQLEPENEDIFSYIIKALEQEPSEDCVSRSDVIKVLNNHWLSGSCSRRIIDEQIDKVKALPPVTPTTCIAKVTFSKDDLQELVDEKVEELAQHMESRWIPVSEELPKEHIYDDGFVGPSEPVLVQLNNKDMKVSRYWGSREKYKDEPWIDLSYPTTLEVVAWMPLPEPYKAEMESEE